jgi:hypothetical protein
LKDMRRDLQKESRSGSLVHLYYQLVVNLVITL